MSFHLSSQNSKSLVAAVIPCRNRRVITKRFLEFFNQQTYRNLRVVIVDANSSDGTQDILLSSFPNVDLVSTDDDSYWTASTNRGIEFALAEGCDYILTINDDSYVNPSYVENLLSLAQDNHLCILASRIDFFKAPGLIWSLGSYSDWGTRDLFGLSYHATWEDSIPSHLMCEEFWEITAAPGNGVLIHKSVFETIGLYDEVNTPHYHADSEFVMRAQLSGIKAYVSPKIVVYNDCPLPGESLSPSEPRFQNRVQQFFYTFFHKKSHLTLWPRIFVISKYCPPKQKIKAYIKGVLIFALEPVISKMKLRVKKVLPSKKSLKRIFSRVTNKFIFVLWR
ncbi:glycosyltransferase family 2 protein [Leptothoe kymatousa]|uniref:Glycosyltransferase family 2 protein n=1 Tax=Leptothoe kymatousa TAU-MAC 1615 TaxID=2364775 RepID=A0ABS5Y578_9CYAN|nr:glycosyltransferase family 2 protein [Leptothoe kymatousa]MBT9312999.1 glycosyltransferase family 2 protein [Leptothoe kymatousa TAU-MAC 1615]